jgi:hypothetical protein
VSAVIASVVFWLVELSALLLILSKQSRQYYRQKPVRPHPADRARARPL